jgi:SAM-dependent methyltransferase
MNTLIPPQKAEQTVRKRRIEEARSLRLLDEARPLSRLPSDLETDPHQAYWRHETLKYRISHFRLRFVAKLLRSQSYRRLLDLGCSGATLKSLLTPDFVYYGCDIASWAEDVLGSDFFQQIDFNDEYDLLRFGKQQIDVVHVGGLLEYLQDPEQLLREIRRVVRPGAMLVASMINFASHYYRVGHHHPQWVYQPSLLEFRQLLIETGWRIRAVHPLAGRVSWRKALLWQATKFLRPNSHRLWANSQQAVFVAEADDRYWRPESETHQSVFESAAFENPTATASRGRLAVG